MLSGSGFIGHGHTEGRIFESYLTSFLPHEGRQILQAHVTDTQSPEREDGG